MNTKILGRLLTLSASLLWAPPAAAQRLPAHGQPLAATDDARALVGAPSNLAFLPAPELRWQAQFLSESASVPWQGHALSVGLPLRVLGLATGLRLDLVDPPTRARQELSPGGIAFAGSPDYQVLTWGLALQTSAASALGLTWQRSFSSSERLHGLSSWTAAFSWRPWDALGVALTAQDLFGADNDLGLRLEPSWEGGLVLRPLGTRALELGVEGRYSTLRERWTPRATLGVGLPVGRLWADAQLEERDARRAWRASVGVEVALSAPQGSTQLGLSSAGGEALGDARGRWHENVGAELALSGARRAEGTDVPRLALRLRWESTPGGREHVALLRRLWALAEHEPGVEAVVLEPRTTPGASYASVEELRDAVALLRARGKKVLCHLEDAGVQELYLCAAADRTLVNPAGGVRFAGFSLKRFYLGSLLSQLGVQADFVRIGAHKSAPEQFMRTGGTETARADTIDLLQRYELEVMSAIATGRRIPLVELRRRIATGPFIAAEARQAGLVDGVAFDDELEREVSKLVGHELTLLDVELGGRAASSFGGGRRVALLHVDGNIIDGRSRTIPLLGTKLVGGYTIAEALRTLREAAEVGAVVLRIDSGGGSAMASDVMWREVALTAKRKPVVVSMHGMAASGGYYVAAPATRIYANPLTITGSIGVFYGKADVSALLSRVGVDVQTYKTTERADAESLYRPFSADERAALEQKVAQFYDTFLGRVAAGRGRTKAEIDAVAQGRVWTGRQALQRGLVDEIGGLRQALAEACRLANLPTDAPLLELPEPDTTWVGRMLGLEGVREASREVIPPQLFELVAGLAPFAVYRADQPLALLESLFLSP